MGCFYSKNSLGSKRLWIIPRVYEAMCTIDDATCLGGTKYFYVLALSLNHRLGRCRLQAQGYFPCQL